MIQYLQYHQYHITISTVGLVATSHFQVLNKQFSKYPSLLYLFHILYLSKTEINLTIKNHVVVVVVWKDIHSRSDTNRTGAEGLSFNYLKLLHCLNQMLAVMLLSQHRVSSSKTVRPHVPCGARCIGHAIRIWSAVCSEAPHSQFCEGGARTHLCMDKWNRPIPVRRRLSLTQVGCDKAIPTGLAPVPGTKTRSLEAFLQYSAFHL